MTEYVDIGAGSVATSSALNNNFTALLEQIDTNNTAIRNLQSSVTNTLSTGGGTMTGTLTIAANTPYIYLKNTSQTAGTHPDNDLYERIYFRDKDGKTLGSIANKYSTNGSRETYMLTYDDTAKNSAKLYVRINQNGVAYGGCPTPPAGSNGDYIATTKWVRDFVDLHNNNSSGNGYCKIGSLILQWGSFNITGSSKGTKEVTLPTAFTGADTYGVSYTFKTSGANHNYDFDEFGIVSQNKSKINFRYTSSSWSVYAYWVAIGY